MATSDFQPPPHTLSPFCHQLKTSENVAVVDSECSFAFLCAFEMAMVSVGHPLSDLSHDSGIVRILVSLHVCFVLSYAIGSVFYFPNSMRVLQEARSLEDSCWFGRQWT